MKRTVIVTMFVLSAACQKDAPPPAQETPAEKAEAPEAALPLAAAAEEVKDQEEKEITLTKELLVRYIGFQEEKLEVLRAALAEWRKETAEVYDKEDPSLADGMKALSASQRITEKLEEEESALREKAGLSEADVEYVGGIVNDIGTQRMLWKQGGAADTLAKMKTSLHRQIAALPPEKRAEAEAEAAEMTKGLEALRDLKEVRDEYGDEAVDLVLEHEQEIKKLMDEQIAVMKELH